MNIALNSDTFLPAALSHRVQGRPQDVAELGEDCKEPQGSSLNMRPVFDESLGTLGSLAT